MTVGGANWKGMSREKEEQAGKQEAWTVVNGRRMSRKMLAVRQRWMGSNGGGGVGRGGAEDEAIIIVARECLFPLAEHYR